MTHARGPVKSLGQHFLTDEHTAAVAARWACAGPDTPILEIGPGRGFLTRHLLAAGSPVVAIEKDETLARELPQRPGCSGVTVVTGDFLEADLAPHAGRTLVGNLPYYVSLAILRKALDCSSQWPRIVFMFQLEVARRIVASHRGTDFGIPSILVSLTHSASLVRKVPAGAFFPRPAVDSALVLMEPLAAPWLPQPDRIAFLDWIAAAFRYRRKTAANALRQACGRSPADTAGAIEQTGLRPDARLEDVALPSLIELWRILK